MYLCILDGETTNPGDLSWAPFSALGDLTVYDFTKPEELFSRAAHHEIVITNKTVLTGQMIRALYDTGLRYIGTLSTGFNVIDLDAAKALAIPVCNVPTYCTQSVAQYVFAMILHFSNQIALHDASVHQGDWTNCRNFCYWKSDFLELCGKTLGIVGYGHIGAAVAKIALSMGMKVLVTSRTKKVLPDGCDFVSKEEVFRQSDFVTLHCPLTKDSTNLINAETLSWMKKSAILINTSRGGVIDEKALADALNEGRIGGAGVDVLSTEPPKADNPLLTAKNCVITPHIAWASKAARSRLMEIAAENVRCWQTGHTRNNVC
ncbi:MAG: D-2-hydroxyacid dehydrogenase [Oscillospiraceae bacterium]|nr:D-2-hydroxyacid dehydrogenase [Oscillospiraceae bacterium]